MKYFTKLFEWLGLTPPTKTAPPGAPEGPASTVAPGASPADAPSVPAVVGE